MVGGIFVKGRFLQSKKNSRPAGLMIHSQCRILAKWFPLLTVTQAWNLRLCLNFYIFLILLIKSVLSWDLINTLDPFPPPQAQWSCPGSRFLHPSSGPLQYITKSVHSLCTSSGPPGPLSQRQAFSNWGEKKNHPVSCDFVSSACRKKTMTDWVA